MTRAAIENSDVTGASRAVFTAIESTTAQRELGTVRTQLPTGYAQLFDAGVKNGSWRSTGRRYPPRLLISKTGELAG
ncbi:hypothetical protein C481_03542 [Natrialba asiatica DSM 12278]|uniref:Uncharacterized protein n=1 Tax=Natrialba asiatica (strain ATCC 700177 / DSM 12278 / JCM 9576 / FERM P-10747 / NBRC 102637 / 172P1) TaxID=29540 RepID=M0B1N4_NATA1|nr:hypothetical protein C481_03542 [Natrialba asiatica DSM 12278]